MKTITLALLTLATGFALVSCDSTKTSEAKDSVAVSAPVVETPAQIENTTAMPLTKLEFLESSFDFGKIDEGKKVEHIFKFKNTGENPLVLKDARASCGCTVPEYTKDTIAPGSVGELKVIYDSANKEGQIEKTVTVTANTEPATTDVKIKAFVLKKVSGPYSNQK